MADDVADVLALADVFALPSESEGFGRVLVEAMAMCRPVVATAVGGVPEIVLGGETGLLVEPANPIALADAVRSSARRSVARRAFWRAGRARAASTFSLGAHVDAVERVYDAVPRARRGRGEAVSAAGSPRPLRLGVDGRELRPGVRTGIGRYLLEILRAASVDGWPASFTATPARG
jgi:hypothetical protein